MTRGDIYMLDFGIPFGGEPGRRRPVVIIQADKDNLYNLNTKVVVPLTSNTINADLRGNGSSCLRYNPLLCGRPHWGARRNV